MILIDTNVIIRWLNDPKQIKKEGRKEIENIDQNIFYSVASLWEIGIKTNSGKLKIDSAYWRLIDEDFSHLNITKRHVLADPALPAIHKDPFDRIIIAQAIVEDLTIITSDRLFTEYPVKVIIA